RKRFKQLERARLHALAHPVHVQPADARARRRIDGGDLRPKGAIADGARHEPGGVPGAHFYDARGARHAHDRVRRSRIEAREPVLVRAWRRWRVGADGAEVCSEVLDPAEDIHGSRTSPSCATTEPGSAFSTSRAMPSRMSSSWSGSWWNTTMRFARASLHRRMPSCQVECPQPT